ncbi:MAG TPA: hypothetical protein VFL82_02145 [Thermomicrobiales bacterium]|nr:hypothetical protein [Thermomicrobiales bacterium]
MPPGEGSTGTGGGDGGDSGFGGPGGDIGAILAYLNHWSFGTDGDYTGNGGYGGDNIGPVGSEEPPKVDDGAVVLLDAMTEVANPTSGRPSRRAGEEERWREIEPYSGAQASQGSLFAFVGQEVNPYSGVSLGGGLPDPFAVPPPPARAASAVAFAAIRRNNLLSSPNLIASNGPIACDPGEASCVPEMRSDANQSSLANTIQTEMDESYAAILSLMEGKAQVTSNSKFDVHEAASAAQRVTQSGEYQLAFQANQLRDHPLEIRRSGVSVGLGHMASGGFMAVGSGLIVYGSGGLALPLIGAMGFATGIAEFSSGAALAFSGATSTEAIRMSGQLDQAFALTSSPTSLVFGTTGLVLSEGRADVAYRFAVVGGLAENAATLRYDPSKLYAAVLPGATTKVEKGAAMLLVKDVAALGHTARAESIETVATKLTRDFTVDDLYAIAAFREEMATSGRLDLAGTAGHTASGAAGPGGGVDFVKYGGAFTQELKLHGPYTWLQPWYLDKASTQSLNSSIKYQLETRALGEQLVPIRSVKHIWISPTEAVRYVGH